jgi:hypothetical protein
VTVRLRPSGPTWTFLISRASERESGSSLRDETKSPKDGPVLRRSEKVVGARRVLGNGASDVEAYALVLCESMLQTYADVDFGVDRHRA